MGNRLRAIALMAGAVLVGRFFGVLAGVGSIVTFREGAGSCESILCFFLGVGVGRPRDAAADTAESKLRAPETRRSPISKGELLAFFLVAVCGDEGEFIEAVRREVRGVVCGVD